MHQGVSRVSVFTFHIQSILRSSRRPPPTLASRSNYGCEWRSSNVRCFRQWTDFCVHLHLTNSAQLTFRARGRLRCRSPPRPSLRVPSQPKRSLGSKLQHGFNSSWGMDLSPVSFHKQRRRAKSRAKHGSSRCACSLLPNVVASSSRAASGLFRTLRLLVHYASDLPLKLEARGRLLVMTRDRN